MTATTTTREEYAAAIRQVLGGALNYLYPAALRVAAATSLADHVAAGPRTIAELAELTGTHGDHLQRVLRLLATRGIFAEGVDGRIERTPASDLLRRDSPLALRSAVLLFTDETYWRPTGRLEDTVRSGECVYGEIFGAQFFAHLAADDERARRFDAGLATMSATEQDAIVAAYDFGTTGTVVDVAGGLGGFLRTVLRAHPGVRGVLVDRAPELGRHVLDEPDLAGRWSTVEADFHDTLPAGADVYVLKRIVHDKSEDECRSILRTCRDAMTDGSRLLVVDAVLPEAEPSAAALLSDVLMLAVFEGRERTEAQFADLVATAGLRLARVVPTASALSVLECVPA